MIKQVVLPEHWPLADLDILSKSQSVIVRVLNQKVVRVEGNSLFRRIGDMYSESESVSGALLQWSEYIKS